LKGDEADNLKQQILQAQIVLDKLREIVYNRVKEAQSTPLVDYDCPSWSHRQAHQNGQVAAFKEIIALLTLDKNS
jgi:hypothetical protein